MRSTQCSAFRDKALPFARRLKCVVRVQVVGIVSVCHCSATV